MLYLAESNQNQTESNQKMPHSVKSKIKMIENAHRAYLFELFEKLQDGDKISGFYELVAEMKKTTTDTTTFSERINNYLKDYPSLCNRVIGWNHSNDIFKLKDTEPFLHIKVVVPVSSPSPYFPTRDVLTSIVQHLPYTALGKLARTCKWMNANITEDQVEKALENSRERFGRVQFFNHSQISMRIWNIEEEPIEFGRIKDRSSILFLRMAGRTYMGHSMTHPFTEEARAAALFVVESSSEKKTNATASTAAQTTTTAVTTTTTTTTTSPARMWYQISNPPIATGHDLFVMFKTRVDGNFRVVNHNVIFDEFQPLLLE